MLKKLTPLNIKGWMYYFYVYNKLTPIKLWVLIFKVDNFEVQSLFINTIRK